MKIKEVLDSMKSIEMEISDKVDRIKLDVALRSVVTNLRGQGFTTEQIKEYISSMIDKI
jgi:DNA-binding transcriptional regulator YhcF (GntR family)